MLAQSWPAIAWTKAGLTSQHAQAATQTVLGQAASRQILECSARSCAGMNQGPRTLSYNPAENMVLITYEAETGGTYELYSVPKDTSRAADSAVRQPELTQSPACLPRLFAVCASQHCSGMCIPGAGLP